MYMMHWCRIFLLSFVIFVFTSFYTDAAIRFDARDYKVSFKEGEVSLSVTIINPTDQVVQTWYRFIVEKQGDAVVENGTAIFGDSSIFLVQEKREPLPVPPKESKTISDRFLLSHNLPDGTYVVRFEALTQDGSPLVSASQDVAIEGTGAILMVSEDACRVEKVVDGSVKPFPARIAPPFSVGEEVKAVCKVINNSSETIAVRPVFIVNEFLAFGYYLSEPERIVGDSMSFSPGASKDVVFVLPKRTKPQVYEAMMQFISSENENNRMSALVPLRWTIEGESARLVSWRLSETKQVSFGNTFRHTLAVRYFGSMDLFWEQQLGLEYQQKGSALDGAILEVRARDGAGNACGEARKDLPAVRDTDIHEETISIESSCEDPLFSVAILGKNGSSLSSASFEPESVVEKASGFASSSRYLLPLIVALLLIAGTVLIKKKRATQQSL